MKIILVLLAFVFSSTAFSAQINLSGGDVIIVRANNDSTVSCQASNNGNNSAPIIRCDTSWSVSSCSGTYLGAPCGGGNICISSGAGFQKDTIQCKCSN